MIRLAGIALLVVSCGVAATPSTPATVVESPFFDGQIATVRVGEDVLEVAVADTSAERSQGLREAAGLGQLDGMLFIHDGEGPVTYTMEDTLIPLDIWFIDAGGIIVGATGMEPCESEPCPSYPSPEPVLWALETEQGRYDFAIGDLVSLD